MANKDIKIHFNFNDEKELIDYCFWLEEDWTKIMVSIKDNKEINFADYLKEKIITNSTIYLT